MSIIGIISDTHLKTSPDLLIRKLNSVFNYVDKVFHIGDIVHPIVLDALEQFGPVTAVRGNMDTGPCVAVLPEKRVVTEEGIRIGMIHGWGPPYKLQERVFTEFRDQQVKVILYGHSHSPRINIFQDCLLLNPGSPTDRRYAPFHSVGILKTSNGRAHGEIIRLD
ncbi:metallophosphoesterase [bacterium]|nr:metallophosphoesterase [bacterium]